MPETVFISYAREDHDSAQWLSRELQAAHIAVFLDTDNIFVGSQWDQEVEQAVQSCTSVVVLVSPSTAQSNNVLQEVNLARQYRHSILPVVICETENLPWYLDVNRICLPTPNPLYYQYLGALVFH